MRAPGSPETVRGPFGPVCDVCGSADRLGLGACVTCSTTGSDALLFFDPANRRADRQVLEAWLVGALDGAVTRTEAREAAVGLRPVVTLPAGAASRAAGVLTHRGVGIVSIPRAKAWKRVPRNLLLLAGATGGVGIFLGLTGTPIMLLLAPLFSALLLLGAFRQLRVPVWRPEAASLLDVSPAVEDRVRSTLARLPDGWARQRLKDLAALAGTLLANDELPAREDFTGAADELLARACDAAVDLEDLDRSLEALERSIEDGAKDPSVATTMSEAGEVRDRLVAGLDEALATLTRTHASTAESPAELIEIAERLAEEATHRSEAWREVQQLAS